MNNRTRPHPDRIFASPSQRIAALPLMWGASLLGIGCILFVIALFSALPRKKKEDLSLLTSKSVKLAGHMEEIQIKETALQKQIAEVRSSLNALKVRNQSTSERILNREIEVRKLEAQNQQQVEETKKRITAAQEIGQQELNSANRVLANKRKEQSDAKHVEDFLKRYRELVVTIATSSGQLASGFFLDIGNSIVVVTSRHAVSKQSEILIRFQYKVDGQNQLRFGHARGNVIYEDQTSGLAFCKLNLKAGQNLITRRLSLKALKQAKVGEKVYAIGTQVMGGQAYEHTVVDGSVSSLDRKFGQRSYMQVSIPANPGTLGSPVVNRDGALIGVLLTKLPQLEKQALVIPASDLRDALTRASAGNRAQARQVPRTPAPPMKAQELNQYTPQEIIKAARKFKLPYNTIRTIPFEIVPNMPVTLIHSSDKLVIFNPLSRRTMGLSKASGLPSWKFQTKLSRVKIIDANNGRQILVTTGVKEHTPLLLDPRSGKALQALPKIGVYQFDWFAPTPHLWLVQMVGQYFQVFNPHTGFFINQSEIGGIPIGHAAGKVYFFARYEGISSFPLNSFLVMIPQLEGLRKAEMKINRRRASGQDQQKRILEIGRQITAQKRAIKQSVKLLRFKGAALRQNVTSESTKFIPADNTVWLGSQCFSIGPETALFKGELVAPPHSNSSKPWFTAFLPKQLSSIGKYPKVLDISPDGAWAVSQTHLFDLKTFKPIAELPLPTAFAGFLPDSKSLCFYDGFNKRLGFLPIQEIISKGSLKKEEENKK